MKLFQFAKRRILLVIILIVVLGIGAIGLVLLNLGKVVNNNKDRILAKAEEILGRKVSVERIDVTLWTGVGVSLYEFSIADDPAYSNDHFVRAGNLDIYFQLLPLFRKQLEISHLILQKPSFKVVQNQDGQYNFSSLLKSKVTPEPDISTPSSPRQAPSLFLARLEVEDGTIDYANLKTKQSVQLTHLDATVRDFSLDKPFPVNLDAAWGCDKKNVSFNGKIGPIAVKDQKIVLNGDLKLNVMPLSDMAKLPSMASSLPKTLQLDGSLDSVVRLDGNLDNLNIHADLNGNNSVIVYNQIYKKPKGMPLKIISQIHYANDSIELQKANLKLAAIDIEGKGSIRLGKALTYDISLQSQPLDVSWLPSVLPAVKDYQPGGKASIQATIQQSGKTPQLQGVLSLNSVSAKIPGLSQPIKNGNGNIQFDMKQAKTDGFSFQLGQSKLNLNVSVSSFSPLGARYDIATDKISLGDLIQPPENMKNDSLEKVTVSGTVSLKDGLQSKGDVISGQGVFYGLNFTNLRSPFQLDNKVLAMNTLSLQTLNGEVEGKIRYDMRQEPPQFDIAAQTKRIDLAELIRTKVRWFPEFIQGKVNMNLDLAGCGASWDTIKPSLQGNGALEIADGMLLNVNIADKVLNGLTGMPGITKFVTSQYKEQYPDVFSSQHTVFEMLKLETAIQGGRLDFKNLLITATDWAINGEGWMNFGEQLTSDALLRLSKGFTSFLTGQVGAFKYLTDENGNMAIPFSLTGILPTLRPQPNADFVGGILQKAVAGQVVDKLNLKGMPGFSNLMQLPFENKSKTRQNLPEIPADKAVKTQVPDATRAVSPAREPQSPTQAVSVPSQVQSATPAISQPTQITPKDLLNPLLKMLDKKKQ